MTTFSKRYAWGWIAGGLVGFFILNIETTTALENVGRFVLVMGVYLGVKHLAMMFED